MAVITIAANNAEVGGGEVMLLALAEALRELGHDVRVVAPAGDSATVGAQARRRGFPTTAILARDRREYLVNLRRWDRHERRGVLWCNGHVPALATVGHPGRIVHLHQAPTPQHVAAGRAAAMGALALVVPSASMAASFPGSQILPNWVDEVERPEPRRRAPDGPLTLGFLGRPSPDKGVVVLARALQQLDAERPGAYHLLLAGEPRFVGDAEQQAVEDALSPVAHLVERPGWMDRADFFARIDLAVFPSVWAEPFGLMVAEAMSARVPFVISDAGALPEVAGPAYPWTARAGDATRLASMIRDALSADAGVRSAQIERSHARWLALYSPDAGRRRLESFLTDVLPFGTTP